MQDSESSDDSRLLSPESHRMPSIRDVTKGRYV